MIETSFTKDELYDPRNVFIQPFYFQGKPEVPGGFRIGAFAKAIPPSRNRITTALNMDAKPSEALKNPLYRADSILFHPQYTNGAITGEFSYESLSNISERSYKPIGVIDGIPSRRIMGDAGRFFSYHHIFIMQSRMIAKAIALKKKMIFHRDRRKMLSYVISVSDVSWDDLSK